MKLILEFMYVTSRDFEVDQITGCLLAVFLVVVASFFAMLVTSDDANKLGIVIIVVSRRIGQYIIDKVIETVVMALLTIFGGLWIFDVLPSLSK